MQNAQGNLNDTNSILNCEKYGKKNVYTTNYRLPHLLFNNR